MDLETKHHRVYIIPLTKDETAGKYGGTSYEFKHHVKKKDYYGSLVYIVNDQSAHLQHYQMTFSYRSIASFSPVQNYGNFFFLLL
jgi:hypothetical protein